MIHKMKEDTFPISLCFSMHILINNDSIF